MHTNLQINLKHKIHSLIRMGAFALPKPKGRRRAIRTQGFTLAEMIIAVGVFGVVATMSLLALLNVKNLQSKSSALRTVNSNLNFAVELMSREIRTGTNYCASGCTPGRFRFTNSDGKVITYEYQSVSKKITRQVLGEQALDITSPQVQVNGLKFFTGGTAPGDKIQPRVTIVINAISKVGRLQANMNVQTTISQREVVS